MGAERSNEGARLREWVAAWILFIAAGCLSAWLPEVERKRLARARGVDPARWSMAWGMGQSAIGALLYMERGIAFMRGAAGGIGERLLEAWQPGLTNVEFQGAGALGWLAWIVYPGSWPFAYLVLVGGARIVAWVATREAIGEPPVVLAFSLVRALRRRRELQARRRRLGPLRPDRWIETGEERVILAARSIEEWAPGLTVEVEERLYRLTAIEEVADGRGRVLAYRLAPLPEGALVRRCVRYERPTGVGPNGRRSG